MTETDVEAPPIDADLDDDKVWPGRRVWVRCERCRYRWQTRDSNWPQRCASKHCRSPYWHRPRRPRPDLPPVTCERCGHHWAPEIPDPTWCPRKPHHRRRYSPRGRLWRFGRESARCDLK